MNILPSSRVLLCVSLLTLLWGCSGSDSAGENGGSLEKVTFNMSWLPQGSMSGVIAAIDRGFYREQGLDVSTTRGFGGIRTVNELDQGMFEFGYGDPLAVILNRANGGKTRMIGAINQRWPAGLCFIVGRHSIEHPQDLAGLVAGGGQNSPVQAILPAWLEANGVARDSVDLMQLDPSVIAASLIEGFIDVGECWLGNSVAVYQKRAREAGVEVDWIEYADFNMDVYGSGLVTSEGMITERPEVVRGFVEATYAGYRWAADNQAEATTLMMKYFPTLDRDITAQQISEIISLMGAPSEFGKLDKGKLENTLSFLAAAYDLEGQLEASDIYTTQFID